VGLTSSADNHAEALLVSIFLKAKSTLNETNQNADPANVNVVISDPSESLTTISNVRYRVASYTVEFFKVEGNIVINPMDY
jgi:hypothetical protein